MLRIGVDEKGLFDRELTELERSQVPFAAVQAANSVAFAIKDAWVTQAQRQFDRPTPYTMRAFYVTKATKQNPGAVVYVKDEATKGGTPPAKYLLPQAEGGRRRDKASERQMERAGILPRGQQAVPGKGLQLDPFGNVPRGLVPRILSQLQAQFDPTSNESETSRARRRKRAAKQGTRGGEFFAIGRIRADEKTVLKAIAEERKDLNFSRKKSHLRPGIYERIQTGFGSSVKSIFIFTRPAQYKKRYDVYAYAEREFRNDWPFYFERELAKAVQTSKLRGKV